MEVHNHSSLDRHFQHLIGDLNAIYGALEVPSDSPRVDYILESLSPRTRQTLEEFVHGSAMTTESLGYCLFFEKPMGWIGVSVYPGRYREGVSNREELDERDRGRFDRELAHNHHLMRGIDAWNEAMEGQGNLVFKKTKRELFDPPGAASNGTEHVFAIHIPATLSVITQHKDLFDKALGVEGSPRAILDAILSCDSITEMFGNDEAVLGLLLGFGRHNALAYRNEQQNITEVDGERVGYRDDRQSVGHEYCDNGPREHRLHQESLHVSPCPFISYEGPEQVAAWNKVLAHQRFVLGTMLKEDDHLLRRCLSYALGHSQCAEDIRWPQY